MKTILAAVGLTFIVTLGSTTSPSAQTDRSRGTGDAVKGGTMAPPAKSTKPKGPTRPNRGEVGTKGVPLTNKECEGLGGKVVDVVKSCAATGKTCYTTDQHGVIRSSCITKLAE